MEFPRHADIQSENAITSTIATIRGKDTHIILFLLLLLGLGLLLLLLSCATAAAGSGRRGLHDKCRGVRQEGLDLPRQST